jgi:glucosylglycerate synthase
VEVDLDRERVQQKIEQTDRADLVVGVVADIDQAGIKILVEALRNCPGTPHIVVLQKENSTKQPATTPDGNDKDAATDATKDSSLAVLPWPLELGAAETPVEIISEAYRSVFAASDKLEARACCIVASTLESVTSQWICELLRPLLQEDFDFVAAHYARRTFGGLLNSSIVYPLTRCLYGKRFYNPMGPDLGVSRRLYQKLMWTNGNSRPGNSRLHALASFAPIALCNNFKVGQVHVGARVDTPTDWMNVGSLMSSVLGPLFVEMEVNASCWQRTRGSAPVPEFGVPLPALHETGKLDIGRMVETFRLGNRDLREIWGMVLPPATLFELSKLARMAPEQFRMPEDLWARIIFDFALAHRLRTINRDHLLGSLAPLYLAWVASYACELDAGASSAEQVIDHVARAFEAGKPYLISRWRWPDRFNP